MKTRIIMLCLIPTIFLSACSENTYEADPVPESGVISAVTENSSETSSAEEKTETESSSETSSVTEKSETESSSEASLAEESETETSSEAETTTESETEKTETETTSEKTESETTAEKTKTESTSENLETKTAQTAEKIIEPDFSGESAVKIIFGEKCVFLDEITDVKKFFGDPPSPEISAPSCLGEGEDIVYSYEDFTVSEFKGTDGKSFVTSIIITGESVKTPKGINVGSDENDALAALGDYYYEEGKYSLCFFAENGKVTEVDVTMLM